MCPECLAKDREQNEKKLQTLLPKFNHEAKAKELTAYAVIQTINSNPGYMWRPVGDESIARATADGRAVSYYTVNP